MIPDFAVSDASPLISLQQIGRLDLLQAQFGRVAVPPAVELEIAPSVGVLPAWVQRQQVPFPADFVSHLDSGEREAIALAIEIRASYVIIDDLPGRRAALSLGLRIIGTLGQGARAKRMGLIGEVRPLMDALIWHGLYAGEGLYRHILAIAGKDY